MPVDRRLKFGVPFAVLLALPSGLLAVDGDVDKAMATTRAETRFAKLDANADGSVVASEAPKPKFMKRCDANGDGKVSKDEFVAAELARFAKMDTNGDGILSASERGAQKPTGGE
jgi:EF hand